MQFRRAYLIGVLRGAGNSPDNHCPVMVCTANYVRGHHRNRVLGVTSKACRQAGVSCGPTLQTTFSNHQCLYSAHGGQPPAVV